MKILSLCSALLIFLSTLPAADVPLPQKLDEIVRAEVRYDLFSGTVLVAQDGAIVYAGAFGEANKEYRIPMVLETRFNISSIQKSFIATVVMQLSQEGKLALSDPLAKYFPDCPWKSADLIQIKHLLNHTSGLGDYRESEEYQANSERYESIEDVLPLVFEQEAAFAPGERFSYSNAGILLIKAIIEKVEGKRWMKALEERVLTPLGMYDTSFLVGGDLLPHRATAYSVTGDGDSYARVLSEPSAYAGGGIYTTVVDLLKFDKALYGDALLSDENKKIMFTPVEASPAYAYGWIVMPKGDTTVVWHSGGSGGFSSEFRRYPEIGLTVVVLSNYEAAAYELANKIESMLLGLPYSLATEADLNFKRAMFLQGKEEYAKATEALEKNLSGDEPHMPSLYQSARSRILGEFEQQKAIALLDRYIELAVESTQPSIAAAWWRKGVAYEQLGNRASALACHRKSLELEPGFEMAREALTRLQTE